MMKYLIYLMLCAAPVQGSASGTVVHDDSTMLDSAETHTAEEQPVSDSAGLKMVDDTFAGFDEFPNLHPLVVHFPVVLLLLALFTHLTGLFVYRNPLSWFTLVLLLGGFIGGLLAARVFHANAHGLSEEAMRIFETHESLAGWTLWLAGIALVLKTVSHFFMNRIIWAELIVLLVVIASAVTVSLTGHLGSQMVYIEDIGPQGNYLEQHE